MKDWLAELVRIQKNRLVDIKARAQLAGAFWKHLTKALRAAVDEFDRETEHVHGFKESSRTDRAYVIEVATRDQSVALWVEMDIAVGVINMETSIKEGSSTNPKARLPTFTMPLAVRNDQLSAVVKNAAGTRTVYDGEGIGELIAHNFLDYVAKYAVIR